MDVAKVEERIDKAEASSTIMTISPQIGGLQFDNMLQVMKFAKLMSQADVAVPPHCRENQGVCLGICIQAIEWRMSPFAVANKSYVVDNHGQKRLAYESQLIHAVIEARAPLVGRLRFTFVGEGDDRRCRVSGLFRGEKEPHVYLSEPLGKLREARGRNERGQIKGSPLWDTNPDVQMIYSGSRFWARIYAPDVLMGVYTQDELEEARGINEPATARAPEAAKDVSPARPTAGTSGIAARLPGPSDRPMQGFDQAHVERETAAVGATDPAPAAATGPVIEGRAEPGPAPDETAQPAKRTRGRPRKPVEPPASTGQADSSTDPAKPSTEQPDSAASQTPPGTVADAPAELERQPEPGAAAVSAPSATTAPTPITDPIVLAETMATALAKAQSLSELSALWKQFAPMVEPLPHEADRQDLTAMMTEHQARLTTGRDATAVGMFVGHKLRAIRERPHGGQGGMFPVEEHGGQ